MNVGLYWQIRNRDKTRGENTNEGRKLGSDSSGSGNGIEKLGIQVARETLETIPGLGWRAVKIMKILLLVNTHWIVSWGWWYKRQYGAVPQRIQTVPVHSPGVPWVPCTDRLTVCAKTQPVKLSSLLLCTTQWKQACIGESFSNNKRIVMTTRAGMCPGGSLPSSLWLSL